MTEFLEKERPEFPSGGLDLTTFGQRLRHLRRARGYTLAELGTRVGRAPSALSLLENGRREPKLSLIESLATALSVPAEELLRHQPPSRRAQLEIAVEEAQRDPLYADLGLPHLKVGARVPNDVLEHLVALYGELRRQHTRPTATPEEARVANAGLRDAMRERGNYFAEIEHAAAEALESVSYRGGALSQGALLAIVGHHGFSVRYAQDLPRSVRSVTDLRHRRIYLKQESMGMHTPRTILLQTLGHFVLGHAAPRDFADFLRQRVEANYFAAAVLVPERTASRFLCEAQEARDLSVEDLRDVFSVSYEMAAHRFTNLATHHLGLTCHFVKNNEGGIIYKAYENDGLVLPADPPGRSRGSGCAASGPGARYSARRTATRRTTSTPTPRPGPSGAWRTWTRARSAAPPSPWAPATRIRGGSGAGTPPRGWCRAARTVTAASGRRPAWPPAGRGWPGRRRGPIHTSCPPCRRGVFPAWTSPTCTSSWTATTPGESGASGRPSGAPGPWAARERKKLPGMATRR